MMTVAAAPGHPLLERSAKLRKIVMLRRTVDRDLLVANIDDHLRWMIGEEEKGNVFLSGPVTPNPGGAMINGLTIFSLPSIEEANRLALEDPLVIAGAVSFELCEWMINEGSIDVRARLSGSSVEFLS